MCPGLAPPAGAGDVTVPAAVPAAVPSATRNWTLSQVDKQYMQLYGMPFFRGVESTSVINQMLGAAGFLPDGMKSC